MEGRRKIQLEFQHCKFLREGEINGVCVLEREMEKFSAINASQQESVIESFVHGFYNLDWFFFAVLSIFFSLSK